MPDLNWAIATDDLDLTVSLKCMQEGEPGSYACGDFELQGNSMNNLVMLGI